MHPSAGGDTSGGDGVTFLGEYTFENHMVASGSVSTPDRYFKLHKPTSASLTKYNLCLFDFGKFVTSIAPKEQNKRRTFVFAKRSKLQTCFDLKA